jgi:hypothetical protein
MARSAGLSRGCALKSEFNGRQSRAPPVERQVINTENIPDPNWIAGFVTGELTQPRPEEYR